MLLVKGSIRDFPLMVRTNLGRILCHLRKASNFCHFHRPFKNHLEVVAEIWSIPSDRCMISRPISILLLFSFLYKCLLHPLCKTPTTNPTQPWRPLFPLLLHLCCPSSLDPSRKPHRPDSHPCLSGWELRPEPAATTAKTHLWRCMSIQAARARGRPWRGAPAPSGWPWMFHLMVTPLLINLSIKLIPICKNVGWSLIQLPFCRNLRPFISNEDNEANAGHSRQVVRRCSNVEARRHVE